MSEANPKGYNFQVRVTSGHEAEAKAALRRAGAVLK